jgi:hypothetical protein
VATTCASKVTQTHQPSDKNVILNGNLDAPLTSSCGVRRGPIGKRKRKTNVVWTKDFPKTHLVADLSGGWHRCLGVKRRDRISPHLVHHIFSKEHHLLGAVPYSCWVTAKGCVRHSRSKAFRAVARERPPVQSTVTKENAHGPNEWRLAW